MADEIMSFSRVYPPATRGRIVVWGYLASYPFGGMTWQVLHYLVSLRQSGFDVWYVEDTDAEVRDPITHWGNENYLPNVKFLQQQMESVGLADRWVFRPPGHYDFCIGAVDIKGLAQLYKDADAVFNLCGSHELRLEHDTIKHLVYIETDPVPNQVAVASGDSQTIAELNRYQSLFTYGENIDSSDCMIPVDHFIWHPTRPPVVLDWWAPSAHMRRTGSFSTVTSWKFSNNDVQWNGMCWRWSKHHEFRRFLALPELTDVPLELAIAGLDDPHSDNSICNSEAEQFRDAGWYLRSTSGLSDPLRYRDYIRQSQGEFTVSKEQYVQTRSGWFSDRSVCYLASGGPVVTQETGFSQYIPCGRGLFSFSTRTEAADALESIASDPKRHENSAKEIAGEYFDGVKVVRGMLSVIGLV